MSMDGRYSARSHGRRCGYVHGWTVFRKEPRKAVRLCPWMDGIPQGATEGGAVMSMDGRYSARSHGRRCGYVHGWTVFRKEPRKAVRLCPWMDGIPQGATEGGAVMSMDGRAENCSVHFPHFPCPCGSYFARSQGGWCGYVFNL